MNIKKVRKNLSHLFLGEWIILNSLSSDSLMVELIIMNSAACGVDFFGGSGASKYGNYWRIRWMAVRYPKRQQRARRAIAHYIYYRPRSKSRIIATRRNQYSGVNWCKLFFISLRTSTFTKIKYLLLRSKQCLMITFIKLLLINTHQTYNFT